MNTLPKTSVFQPGMELRLDDTRAMVVEVMTSTRTSMLCRVRVNTAQGIQYAVLKVLSSRSADTRESSQFRMECYTAIQLSAQLPNRVPYVHSLVEECKTVERRGGRMECVSLGNGLLMEDVVGVSLRKHTYRQSRDNAGIGLGKMLPIALEATGILGEVHEKGIIHCDVKEDHFILRPTGRLCLIDFGISQRRLSSSALDEYSDDLYNAVRGTLAYMPPEVLIKNDVSVCSLPEYDLYSLGVLIYNMHCCGGRLGQRGLPEVINRLQSGPIFPELRALSPLNPIINKLLAERGERYTDTRAVLADLQTIVCTYPSVPHSLWHGLKGLVSGL